MPQVDLEALVSACAGGARDGKISCETVGGGGGGGRREDEDPPDLPDSVLLSKDAEFDWFDRNAFYERRDSTKANSSPAAASNPILSSPTNSNSRRSSNNFKSRRRSSASRSRRARASSTPEPAPLQGGRRRGVLPEAVGIGRQGRSPAVEPSSPKVSCMGRVRSKRKRTGGRGATSRLKGAEPGCSRASSRYWEPAAGIGRRSWPTCRGRRRPAPGREEAPTGERRGRSTSDPPAAEGGEPPSGLGGVKRFRSGRRPDSWANNVA
ncbi:serine/arginine repetitive matrix protein 2-like [Eucalyptus grandis]|uniref:serine/arginine repetitive matrix protein 2-like n=1 Tax=Eucalyptus grandis TaxID=71139 RepID=UPI00192EE674|nr:serine/arginine repetitive matrix protein 2-like [Eucalyptus grandis]